MPPGASLQRTDEVLRAAQRIALANPAVQATLAFAGLDGATFTTAPNAATMFVTLKPHEDRASAEQVTGELRQKLAAVTAGAIVIIPPPPVRGIGTGGGFKMIIEDRSGAGYRALGNIASTMIAANQAPGLQSVLRRTARGRRAVCRHRPERAERLGAGAERLRLSGPIRIDVYQRSLLRLSTASRRAGRRALSREIGDIGLLGRVAS